MQGNSSSTIHNSPLKKGYKQTDLGVIPEDWEVKKLGEVGKIVRGASPRPIENYITNKGINWIKISDVSENDKYIKQSKTQITQDGARKSVIIDIDDFILSNSMSYGRPYISKIRGCIHDGWLLFKFSTSINRHFLYYLIKTDRIQNTFNLLAAGSGVNNLKIPSVKNISIPLPPLPEQQAIARVLSDVDELIEALDKLIAKKEKIKKGAMQELLTGKRRLPGFGEGKGYKQTDLGVIPEDWEVKKLGEVLKYEQPWKYLVQSTDYLESGFIPVLTPGKTFILGYTKEREEIYQNLPVIIFDDFTTASKFVTFPFKVKSSALKLLKLKDSSNNLKFLYKRMQLIKFIISDGDHKRRWIAEYQNIEIPLPPLPEQQAIARVLSDMDEEIEALKKKKQKYENTKKGMMQVLLTGKIRLKEFFKE